MYHSNHIPPVLSMRFLNDLYNRSVSYTRNEAEIVNIEKYINYLEDYILGLQQIGFMNSENEDFILSQIAQINVIRSLPPQNRGIYGATTADNSIYLNPDLHGNGILSNEERIRLYTFHELGHLVHGMYQDDIQKYVESMSRKYSLSQRNRKYLEMGFDLIDEACVQETAENLAYKYARKQRPQFRQYSPKNRNNGKNLYGNFNVLSNFDYYVELEAPAVMLTKTMRGIGTNQKDRNLGTLMSQLAQRSFNPDFIKDLSREFLEDGYERDLVLIMHRMGIIKDASYGMFGMAEFNDSMDLAPEAFNTLRNRTTELTDWRPRVRRSGQSGIESR